MVPHIKRHSNDIQFPLPPIIPIPMQHFMSDPLGDEIRSRTIMREIQHCDLSILVG